METLKHPDVLHLQAAEGWLGLGNHIEANEELEQITPQLRTHPDVLEMRWQIYAKEKRWEACVEIARALIQLAPSRPIGWINLAYASRRTKGGSLQAAWEALLPMAERFPAEPIVPFNLACYACQLKRLDGARDWLQKAFENAKKKGCFDQIRLMALDEADLEPLWGEMKNATFKLFSSANK